MKNFFIFNLDDGFLEFETHKKQKINIENI